MGLYPHLFLRFNLTTMKPFLKFVLYSSALLALIGAAMLNMIVIAYTNSYTMRAALITVSAIAWVWIAVAFLRFLVNEK